MKTFPTLYKRTKTGAIQQWSISCEPSLHGTAIIKDAGQVDGKLTRHEELITAGKQKRTIIEQAEFMAESDWKRKHDEGYKSLEDLSLTHMANQPETLLRALQGELPEFNTDAAGNAKPMLAKTVNWDKVKYPCLLQPKLDGVRCLMIVNFMRIAFLSRSGKEYTTLEHIANDVIKASENGLELPFILDGEIYSDELSFQEIVAAVKKQRPDSLKLKFRAYDVINDEVQEDRWDTTLRIVDAINSDHISTVHCLLVNTREMVKEMHDAWVSEGYEGAMIRHMDGIYGQGQRSSDLLKVKEFDETEFTFIRFELGQREEDLIAVCAVKDGTCFKAKVIGTRDEKKELRSTPEKELEYKQYTVKHFGWTDDGLPRFPIGKSFRDY